MKAHLGKICYVFCVCFLASLANAYSATILPTPKQLFAVGRPGLPIESSPALSPDLQTLYVGAGDGSIGKVYAATNLYASTPPQIRWEFIPDGAIGSASPSVAPDGTVYIGSQNGTVYAINPDGSQKWRFFAGDSMGGSPAISSTAAAIFVGTLGGRIFSIGTFSGSMNWEVDAPGPVTGGIAIGRDGTLYVPIFLNAPNDLIALNPTTGAIKWQTSVDNIVSLAISSSPALGNDGTIFVGTANSASGDNRITAVHPVTGEVLGTATFSAGYLDSSPSLAPAYGTFGPAAFAGIDFMNEVFRMNLNSYEGAEISLAAC